MNYGAVVSTTISERKKTTIANHMTRARAGEMPTVRARQRERAGSRVEIPKGFILVRIQ